MLPIVVLQKREQQADRAGCTIHLGEVGSVKCLYIYIFTKPLFCVLNCLVVNFIRGVTAESQLSSDLIFAVSFS